MAEIEQRWILPDAVYNSKIALLRKMGFLGSNRYIQDIYYDNEGPAGLLKNHERLIRARIVRESGDKRSPIIYPIKIAYKGRLLHDGTVSRPEPEKFKREFHNEEEFHNWEAMMRGDIKRRGHTHRIKYFPVMAFTRYREALTLVLDEGGCAVVTEGDIIVAYEIDGSIGLDYRDSEGRKRMPRALALEAKARPRDESIEKRVIREIAVKLSLSDNDLSQVLFWDLILQDAGNIGIIGKK